MSGHSKWSTIKRQKGANDAKRGQIFTKLGNAITVAVREGGGGDPNSNFKLRLAIEDARSENVPKENIERAIERGLGKGGGAALETITYEGYGPYNVAVIVEAITDNRNRAGSEIRTGFDKYGGTMGTPGSVSWQFDQVGQISVTTTDHDPEELMLQVIDAGAADVEEGSGELIVYTEPQKLQEVKQRLIDLGLEITNAGLMMRPKQVVEITSADDAQKVITFLERLENLDDVNSVASNVSIPESILG